MVAWNLGPTWANQTRTHYRNSTRPIVGSLAKETAKAFKIRTATRTAWLPKSLVSHDPQTQTFTVPSWLAQKKLLD